METMIRPATLEDARMIGENLREPDRRETEALGLRPLDAAVLSFYGSDLCFTGCIDGVPSMLFGAGAPLLSDTAYVWAVGTPRCDRAPVAMVKVGRAVIARLLEVYPALENYCDARYVKAHRWLELLGFTLGEPEPYGPKRAMFRKLSIHRKEA